MLKVFVLGTAHECQSNCKIPRFQGLQNRLASIRDKYDISKIAEEVDADQDVWTYARNLVGDDRWISIDMKNAERERAEIPRSRMPNDRYGNPCQIRITAVEDARESFWLNRIEACSASDDTVLLICGADHVRYLVPKILRRGHKVPAEFYFPDILADKPPLPFGRLISPSGLPL